MTTAQQLPIPLPASDGAAPSRPDAPREAPSDRAVLLVGDPVVADEVARQGAAVGHAPLTTAEVGRVVERWAVAPLVLVDAGRVAELAALAPPGRPGVHVVGGGPADADVLRAALALGATQVHDVVSAPEGVGDLLAAVEQRPAGASGPLGAAGPAARTGWVLGVVGGSGGVGATTLACALGQVAGSTPGGALVVDADPLGPGVDRVLGVEARTGDADWTTLGRTHGRLSSRSLSAALARRDGVACLPWGPPPRVSPTPEAVRAVLAAARGAYGRTMLDLGRPDVPARGPGLAARCDLVLVVVRPSVAGLASAAHVRRTLGGLPGVGLVVRSVDHDARGSVPADDVADLLGAPVLGRLPHQRGLDEAVDVGLGPAHRRRARLTRAAADLVAVLDDRLAGVVAAGRWAA